MKNVVNRYEEPNIEFIILDDGNVVTTSQEPWETEDDDLTELTL